MSTPRDVDGQPPSRGSSGSLLEQREDRARKVAVLERRAKRQPLSYVDARQLRYESGKLAAVDKQLAAARDTQSLATLAALEAALEGITS